MKSKTLRRDTVGSLKLFFSPSRETLKRRLGIPAPRSLNAAKGVREVVPRHLGRVWGMGFSGFLGGNVILLRMRDWVIWLRAAIVPPKSPQAPLMLSKPPSP